MNDMNRIITIFLLTIIFALSVNIVFAQGTTPTPKVTATDDSDGDGIKNSEDTCPNDKGTVVNKGCPGKDDETMSAEEAKKQKEKLDSLKSNIDILATPTPTPPPAPSKVIQAPQPDCKYILDFDKCRNIVFAMSREEIVKQFGTPTLENFDLSSYYHYKGMKIDVAKANFIYGIVFNGFAWDDEKFRSPYTERIPAPEIKWGDGKDKIIKRFGNVNPQKIKGVNGEKFENLWYDEQKLQFEFTNGRLTKIGMKRKISDDEYARSLQIYRQKQAEIEAQKTPEQRAKENPYGVSEEIRLAFDRLHEQIVSLTNEANRLVKDYNANQYVLDSIGQRYRREKAVSNLHIQAADLIRKFLKDHNGKLPKAMTDHLENDINKILRGEGH